MNISRFVRRLAVLLVGTAASVAAYAGPPPWAPAHGHHGKHVVKREYHYVYYPARQVYYAPASRGWFWMSGGNWQFGLTLPAQYRPYTNGGVQVTLHSSRPYLHHAHVEQRYGRPWRDKHRAHDRHHRHDDRRGRNEHRGHHR